MPNIAGPIKVAERLSGRTDIPQDVREVLFALAEDVQVLKACVNGITSKLDAENVTNMDTNYNALWNANAVHVTP